MTKALLLLALSAVAGGAWLCLTPRSAAAPGPAGSGATEEETEEPLALDAVPAGVLAAAKAAVAGIELQHAELETEHGAKRYCLHGTVKGRGYEIEVSPDGKVVEVGDDDGDDESDDDGDDGDD
jgi:hypothetical protein